MNAPTEGAVLEGTLLPAMPPMPNDEKLSAAAQRFLEQAKAMVIDSDDMLSIANDELKAIKKHAGDLSAERVELTKPLDDLKKKLMDKFRKPLAVLDEAEGIYKRTIGGYLTKREDARRAAQARADEEARKEAEKLQKRAEKAEASGNIEKAQALAATATAVAASAPIVPATPKVDGLSTAKLYKGEVTDFAALLRFVADNPMFRNLIEVNQAALNKAASSFKEQLAIPGVKLVIEQSVRSRV